MAAGTEAMAETGNVKAGCSMSNVERDCCVGRKRHGAVIKELVHVVVPGQGEEGGAR